MLVIFFEIQILVVFGQIEMLLVICMLFGEDVIVKCGLVGRVILIVVVRVVDQNMNDVFVGEVGEIVYWVLILMSCYWNNLEVIVEVFVGGWFYFGDLVCMDFDGYVWVVDCKKDMIIFGGENIYCVELENVLVSYFDIVEVVVIGWVDEKWGEVLIVVVVVKNDDFWIEDLGEFLIDWFVCYKYFKVFEIVDVLFCNFVGKVFKIEL